MMTTAPLDSCPTCCRPAGLPYRRWDDRGKVIEGCVAEWHTGHLTGESLRWHTRDEARAMRRQTAEFLTSLDPAHPMRDYGLPGRLKLTGQNRPVRVTR